jgi:hypothetical protein
LKKNEKQETSKLHIPYNLIITSTAVIAVKSSSSKPSHISSADCTFSALLLPRLLIELSESLLRPYSHRISKLKLLLELAYSDSSAAEPKSKLVSSDKRLCSKSEPPSLDSDVLGLMVIGTSHTQPGHRPHVVMNMTRIRGMSKLFMAGRILLSIVGHHCTLCCEIKTSI